MSGTSRLAEWFRGKRGLLRTRIPARKWGFRPGYAGRGATGPNLCFPCPYFGGENGGAAKGDARDYGGERVMSGESSKKIGSIPENSGKKLAQFLRILKKDWIDS
jgi:hypothetical protein